MVSGLDSRAGAEVTGMGWRDGMAEKLGKKTGKQRRHIQ